MRGLQTLSALGRSLLDLLYPPLCVGCEGECEDARIPLCRHCFEAMQRLSGPVCESCGAPVPLENVSICPQCPKRPLFDLVRSALDYRDPLVDRVIYAYKFEGCATLAEPLGMIFTEAFDRFLGGVDLDIIVPIALHRRRERIREYNQSTLLAERLSAHCGLPLRTDLHIRARHTQPQSRLHQRQRERNMRNAFVLTHPAAVKGKRILFIDDILTTGNTINEAAKIFRQAGAQWIGALTLARALSHRLDDRPAAIAASAGQRLEREQEEQKEHSTR